MLGITIQEWAILFTTVTGILGPGFAWVIHRADRKSEQTRNEITERIKNLETQILRLRDRERIMVKHIGRLEGLLIAKGITIPEVLRISDDGAEEG